MAEVAGRTFSRVHHVAYIVRDIEASLAFYRDTLGLELRNDVGEEFGEDRVADVLRRGGPAP